MGAQITGVSFMGEPMTKARNIVRRIRGHETDPLDLWWRHDVTMDPRLVAAMIGEMGRRGWLEIGDHGWTATEKGTALSAATARKRTPRAKAEAVLDAFLANCEALNADMDEPRHVDEVWLYGSMLGDGADVGDVDIVATSRWSPRFAPMERIARFEAARDFAYARLPASALTTIVSQVCADQTWFDRRIYGARRHPLLSKQAGIEDLKDMGCPCRLIFSAAEGGRVDGKRLDRHPQSTSVQAPRPDIGDPTAAYDAPVKPPRIEVSDFHTDCVAWTGGWEDRPLPPPTRMTATLPKRKFERLRGPHLKSVAFIEWRHYRSDAVVDAIKAFAKDSPAAPDETFVLIRDSGAPVAAVAVRRAIADAGPSTQVTTEVWAIGDPATLRPVDINLLTDYVLFVCAVDAITAQTAARRPVETTIVRANDGPLCGEVVELAGRVARRDGWYAPVTMDSAKARRKKALAARKERVIAEIHAMADRGF